MDRVAIQDVGIAGYTLMERAAAAALRVLRERWPSARALRIYCGLGNNAGDGYVLARLADGYGLRVAVVACGPLERLGGDAATAARDCVAAGIEPVAFEAQSGPAGGEIVVDALFGTGLARPLEGVFADAVAQIAAAKCAVMALDVPSGIDADTGLANGPAVRADCTVAFVGLKAGYFLGVAPDHCGVLEFASLDIPDSVSAQQQPVLRRLSLADIGRALPRRRRTAHKGDNGRLLIIGGGPGMAGAVRMAGEAALRSGAGLVYIATHPRHAAFIAAQVPELIVHPIDSPQELDAAQLSVDAIALGPGLGRSAWASALCEWALGQPRPLVIDADGLNWLAADGSVAAHSQARILTPHPGEAGRLLGESIAAVQNDRLAAVRTLAERYGSTVVLKGARSLIAGPAAATAPRVCVAGNPGMASAGSGDVLTGITGAVLVQCGDAPLAADAAVLIHALAGDAAAAAQGERGLLATDLLQYVQQWANPS